MIKCAAIQMASGPSVSSNLLEAEKLIAEAVKTGAKLVVLPENFAMMGDREIDKLKIKEVDGSGPIQHFLSSAAKKYSVWIIGGTIPIAGNDENKVRAACVIYNDQGVRVARYDKMHLFDVNVPGTDEVYRESDSIERGDQLLVLDSPFGKLGIAVCYDLRFPEFFRKVVEQGMEILVIPSAFTAKTGSAHWEVLLRARAIENLCYVIAPNQGGFHLNGRKTYGHSMIVDPWGVVLDCYKTGAGFVAAELDLERLAKVRSAFPYSNTGGLAVARMRTTPLVVLVALMLAACGTTDNSRYQDNANLERPPELPIDKQAAEQSAANELEAPKRRHGKGLKSDVYRVEASPTELRIKRSFDEAWSLLNRALQHNDLKVTDQDRSKGFYYVAYNSSFFGKAASFFEDERNQPTYLLKVEAQDEETRVTANFASKDEQSTPVSPKNADGNNSSDTSQDQSSKLIELLYDTLHDNVKDE